MEKTSSTINKTWSTCTIAGFIAFILLVPSLNQGQGSLSLSALQNLAKSKKSSNPTCTQELLGPKNFTENKNPVDGEERKCNIFDGNWVYDPERSPLHTNLQCPFLSGQVSCQRNGRPDSEYEKWRWEAKGCKIPRFNGTDMLERLRGKRLIIAGDSLNRNQWESLACLLYSAIPNSSQAHVDVKSALYKVFKAKNYNCSVEFYWSPFLVEHKQKYANETSILRLDKLSSAAQEWQGADVMVFNTGHWWRHRGKYKACAWWDLFQYDGKLVREMEIRSAFEMALGTWANWLDSNVDSTKTRVFFRSISPEHKGEASCDNSTQFVDESYVYAFPKSLKDIVERTIEGMKTPVRYLNITKLSEYRRDAHPAMYALTVEQRQKIGSHPDCSHWCVPGLPDTWNKLLYAAIVLDS